jgi:putative membrane protein (TIGR04086 family)
MKTLDTRVLVSGIVAGLFFALPAAVLRQALGSDSLLSSVMLGVVLFSGALAGFAAARPLPRQALLHGAIAGAITFLGAQLVYTLWTRTRPNPIALVFWLLSFASLGTIGAWVAVWKASNSAKETP